MGSFGGALASGYGQASNDLNGAMQTAYRNALLAKEDKRATDAEQRAIAEQQRQIQNDQWNQQFRQAESTRTQGNVEAQQKAAEAERKALEAYRTQQTGIEQKRLELEAKHSGIPVGYELDPANPSGLRPIAGGPADPNTGRGKITDAERLTAAYAQRMKSAGDTIDKLNYVPTASELSAFNYLIGEPGIKQSVANAYLSPDAQQYFQALSDFSRAKLRKESGAVIGKDEISGDLSTFFPLPGDDPKTVAQKRAARETALQGMITAAGPAYQASQNAGKRAPTATKKIGNTNYVQIGGNWYEDNGASTGQ